MNPLIKIAGLCASLVVGACTTSETRSHAIATEASLVAEVESEDDELNRFVERELQNVLALRLLVSGNDITLLDATVHRGVPSAEQVEDAPYFQLQAFENEELRGTAVAPSTAYLVREDIGTVELTEHIVLVSMAIEAPADQLRVMSLQEDVSSVFDLTSVFDHHCSAFDDDLMCR